MPYYETVYETGANSLGFYESDEEALEGAKTHHMRAITGAPALASATGREACGSPPVADASAGAPVIALL